MPPACFFGAAKGRNGWAFSQNRQGTRFFLREERTARPGKTCTVQSRKSDSPQSDFLQHYKHAGREVGFPTFFVGYLTDNFHLGIVQFIRKLLFAPALDRLLIQACRREASPGGRWGGLPCFYRRFCRLGLAPNWRLYWREKLDKSEKPAKVAASVTP